MKRKSYVWVTAIFGEFFSSVPLRVFRTDQISRPATLQNRLIFRDEAIMRPDTSLTVLRVSLATLMLANITYTTRRQKRQLFRENVLPYFGGKIPDSAFRADRLALNMLNKEGISVPDGILFEARPKESFHQNPRNDPEITNSIIKMIHTPDGRFVPSEGQYEAEHEVDTTYKILIPGNIQNYQLPRFTPVSETLQLPIRQVYDSGLSVTPIRGQLGFPFYPKPQDWNLQDVRRQPYTNAFNQNVNKIINFNTLHFTTFGCNTPGKIYPDPGTQCQVFHLCHYNGLKETFVCPQGTRYDPAVQECKIWYITPCLNAHKPYIKLI